MNNQALQDNCPTYITAAKVENQGSVMKDLKIEEPQPKAQDLKPTNYLSGNTKISEKAWKEFKKRFWKEKRKQRNFSSGIPATGGNIIYNKVRPKRPKKDLSEIIYYQWHKKKYYSRIFPKFKKDNAPKN